MSSATPPAPGAPSQAGTGHAETGTVFAVLLAVAFCHTLNDTMQSLLSGIYPLLKDSLSLTFAQIGVITLTTQITASILQPLVGLFGDRRALPVILPLGATFTFVGMVLLAFARSYPMILLAAALIGVGSSTFHPESSRVARMASGGRHGLAQSMFQVGGNIGAAAGPLLAALIVLPHGSRSLVWFSGVSLLSLLILSFVARWYATHGINRARAHRQRVHHALPRRTVIGSIFLLTLLLFSKFIYLAAFSSYYTFYLIERFHIGVRESQLVLFGFLLAAVIGTFAGGPLGDRFGRKYVIWFSILGAAPFALMLPYAGYAMTIVLSVIVSVILSSAFAAIVVFGQDLMPGKVGAVSGLFFGLSFGIGGVGAAVLGALADHIGVVRVFDIVAFLPLIGLATFFLPDLKKHA